MAGSIYISANDGWFGSTVVFDYIIDQIQATATEADDWLSEVLAPREIGYNFIDLGELSSSSYKQFVRLSKAAFERCAADLPNNAPTESYSSGIMEFWGKLNRQLEQDARFATS